MLEVTILPGIAPKAKERAKAKARRRARVPWNAGSAEVLVDFSRFRSEGDHMARDCPDGKGKSKGKGKGKPIECFNCGGDHFVGFRSESE